MRGLLGGWMASVVVHGTIVLLLAVISVQGRFSASIELVQAPSETWSLEDRGEFVFTLPTDESTIFPLSVVPVDERIERLGDPRLEQIEVMAFADREMPHSPLYGDSGWFGELVAGGGRPSERQSGISFLGVQATGSSFVYVVDRSGSMQGSRWLETRTELIRSIRSLSDEHTFFVILFNHDATLMFDTAPRRARLLPATADNVAQFERWIYAQEPFGYTRPKTAMLTALGLKPDIVFLMSDGLIQDDTREMLLQRNRVRITPQGPRVPVQIHAIAFKSFEGHALLEAIANENQGTFQFVP